MPNFDFNGDAELNLTMTEQEQQAIEDMDIDQIKYLVAVEMSRVDPAYRPDDCEWIIERLINKATGNAEPPKPKPYINLYKQPREDWHECHFCGTFVNNGRETKGQRHWLSDCRPDLVKHKIGDDCTWAYRRKMTDEELRKEFRNKNYTLSEKDSCYAYQEGPNGEWIHTKFYKDGPM